MMPAEPSLGWHQPHITLPGYHAAQILHVGCRACEELSAYPWLVISAMEADQFEQAWERAVTWNIRGLDNASTAEVPVLQVILACVAQFAKRGIEWGAIPSGARTEVAA